MTILKKIIGTTTLTAVAGTALYFYSDEKTKNKIQSNYQNLRDKLPILDNIWEDKKPESTPKDQ